ncbi:MAG: iron hydrogenase small subunit, partial [Clostridia bacterium]|nr:iron hydrogenase small subunit [Clostridia bacterium]
GLDAYRAKRASALYEEDRILPVRKSHENTQIQQLYKDFLGEPGSHISHHLLHTTYAGRKRFGFEE